ncbi:MAG: dTDP-4-dehydrorhamnose 3,5-epimerase family protein [Vicinamibacterales bacterium]
MSRPPEQDPATVTSAGEPLTRMVHGVTFRRAVTHVDERGTVCEMFDERWSWHPDPLVFSYLFTLRPGMIKGWGMHKRHDDRYFLISGELLLVLYDGREDSPTHGLVSKLVLSEYDRRLVSIPSGVWHANQNIGEKDVLVVNFPTQPYDHEHPDKYRLPLDTDQIPYRFDNPRGW